MKKIILFSMLAVMAVITTAKAQESDLSTLTDAVYVQPLSAPVGSQQILSVRMKNSIEVQTIQFDFYLPEGLNIVANEDYELMTASKERINKFNYFSSSIQADGALRLLAQATTTNVPIGDGEIAKVIVNIDNTMSFGDYPMVVKNTRLVSKENDAITVEEVSTMITITEPGDTRTVLDETSTTVPASATNVDVRVKRTIKANEWSTIVLPFAMNEAQVKEAFGDDVQLADFTGADSEFDSSDNVVAITANFTDVQAIEANHPYIIKVSAAITEFTVDGVDIEADEDEAYIEFDNGKTGSRRVVYSGFYGTYHAQTTLEEFSLFLNSNKFWYSAGLTKMKAFRAYFYFLDILTEVENGSANVKMFVNMDDDETGIVSPLWDKEEGAAIYNLAGQRVSKNYKGIVIENGKKTKK